jgi:hypothetical protein
MHITCSRTPSDEETTTIYIPHNRSPQGRMTPTRRQTSLLHLPACLQADRRAGQSQLQDPTPIISLPMFLKKYISGLSLTSRSSDCWVPAPQARSRTSRPLVVIPRCCLWSWYRSHHRKHPWPYARCICWESTWCYQRCQRKECCCCFLTTRWKPESRGEPSSLDLYGFIG